MAVESRVPGRVQVRPGANGGGNGNVQPLLEVRNLKTQFFTQDGIVKAVDDVTFYVMPGETLTSILSARARSVARSVRWARCRGSSRCCCSMTGMLCCTSGRAPEPRRSTACLRL